MTRITHRSIAQSSLANLQRSLGRIAGVQEQLSSGRVLNRPSDSPTGTVSALQLRADVRATEQHMRNAQDGLGWLGTADTALQSASGMTARARQLVLTGLNATNQDPAAREALATELSALRESLIGVANTTYLDRPVFGGTTDGGRAFALPAGTYAGDGGQVLRRTGADVQVRVDVDGEAAFGPDGELFAVLEGAAADLRAGDFTTLATRLDGIQAGHDRVLNSLADVGARYARLVQVDQTGQSRLLELRSALGLVESVDLPRAVVQLQTEQVAYQAALGATAKVVQPSLLDFLR